MTNGRDCLSNHILIVMNKYVKIQCLQSCPLPFILIDCRFVSRARVPPPDLGVDAGVLSWISQYGRIYLIILGGCFCL